MIATCLAHLPRVYRIPATDLVWLPLPTHSRLSAMTLVMMMKMNMAIILVQPIGTE